MDAVDEVMVDLASSAGWRPDDSGLLTSSPRFWQSYWNVASWL
jgi:hypothetical protein